jgi:hypothetical protein
MPDEGVGIDSAGIDETHHAGFIQWSLSHTCIIIKPCHKKRMASNRLFKMLYFPKR